MGINHHSVGSSKPLPPNNGPRPCDGQAPNSGHPRRADMAVQIAARPPVQPFRDSTKEQGPKTEPPLEGRRIILGGLRNP